MPARHFLIAYVSTAVAFLLLDAIWLGIMADRLYRPTIGHLMREPFAVAPAAVFYLLYVAGIVVFAVAPALHTGRWSTALGFGALLGLFAYATYTLTNQATLKDWTWTLAIADLCWGTFVTAAAAAAAARITLALR